MYRVKKLLESSLTLRNYYAKVGETYAMIKALNKLTGIGMAEYAVFDLYDDTVESMSSTVDYIESLL